MFLNFLNFCRATLFNFSVLDWVLIVLGVLLVLLLIYDLTQKKLPILRNFPVLGHLRYLLIEIGPEIRQYLIANNREERPFSRNERDWIYRSAAGRNNYFGFGTDDNFDKEGHIIIKNATVPYAANSSYTGSATDGNTELSCAKVFGESNKRAKPYHAQSLINISAMSYGSLSSHAIAALNKGAKEANCYHNTGEGGLSAHHKHGADVMFQMGTGKFGCRDLDGNFSVEALRKLCEDNPCIKTIEIKLSQGAKPGKGGVLPAAKVTEEIAEIRGIRVGEDCISPNRHKEFSTPKELLAFVETCADATGLPVGIKTAVGKTDFFEELATEMKRQGTGIDFLTVDGGEGGTGAAPLMFADHVSLPFTQGFTRIYKIFRNAGLSENIVFIGSGRLGFPERAVTAMALGCDLVHIAREAMLSIGCIQAQKCHTGGCPTGVATHNPWLVHGLNEDLQGKRLARYVKSFQKDLAAAAHAAGYPHPAHFTMEDIEINMGDERFSTLKEIYGYDKVTVPLMPIVLAKCDAHDDLRAVGAS